MVFTQEVSIPFAFEMIIAAVGTVSAFIFASPTAFEAEQSTNRKSTNRTRRITIGIGLGLLYLYFMLPVWFKFYHLKGAWQMVIVWLITIIPIWLFPICRNIRTYRIALLIFLVLYSITAIILAYSGYL